MENFIKQTNINLSPADKKLGELIQNLQVYFDNQQKNFCQICFCVFRITDYFNQNYVRPDQKTNEYYDKYKLLSKFGFDKTAVSRMTNCYLRFMTGTTENSVCLKSWLENFSSSKLYELLKLADLTLEDSISKGLITPQMTVKEIREYIKQVSTGSDKAEKVLQDNKKEIDEEDIPMAFNPKQHYDIEYFDSLSKKQLVNIAWEYQKYCEKLTKPTTTKMK